MRSLPHALGIAVLWLALCLTGAAKAEFRDVQLFRFAESAGAPEVQSFASERVRDASGLSVARAGARGFTAVVATPLLENSGSFRLNDVVVTCFTPTADMYVKIIDTNPKGVTSRVFPLAGREAAFVRSGVEYCIGDPASESTWRMGTPSGAGTGVLWFQGASRLEALPPDDAADLPSIDVSPNGVGPRDRFVEAWFTYSVK